jgi:DNA-binding beta-propeller fold protein YncE
MNQFDISFVDAATGYYYFADRSNASVDIINGATNKVVAQAGGFTGQQATTSVSGPDGVLVAGTTLYAGDGNSTLKSFNVSNPASPTPMFAPISTGGKFRVDEMAYSPTTNQLLVANNADSPAFGTLLNATTGQILKGNITVPGSPLNGGLEQSVWNPKTGTFFISVPAFNGTGNPGGVAEIDKNGNVIATFNFASMGISSCSPTGLAVGASGHLAVGCGNAGTQTIIFDPTANGGKGAILTKIAGVSGSDELWYDPATGNYFVTGVDASGNRIFAVVSDATNSIVSTTSLPDVNAHSIAVDPLNGEVFVPLPASLPGAPNAVCPNGCVGVYSIETAVPEPSSLALTVVALLSTAGAGVWARRKARRH